MDTEQAMAAAADWQAPAAAGPVRATVALPASKSMTNRALVLAALAAAPTLIRGPLAARDTALMSAALRALGCAVTDTADGWLAEPGPAPDPAPVVDVGNAGTVLRFVPPVAALTKVRASFRGDARAAHRPVAPLLAALRSLGARIDDGDANPVLFTVHGTGSVPGGAVTMDASASSQLISGLLLAGARFSQGLQVTHEGPPVPSAPHLAMTVAMLRACGIDVETGPAADAPPGRARFFIRKWQVRPGQLAPGSIDVEPDLSAAMPFLAAALVTGGEVTISGWPDRSLQPAERILELLTAAGATASRSAAGLTVSGRGPVRGITADLSDVSELAPVLAAVAAVADAPSELAGIGHTRRHETDRLAGLAAEIGQLGGNVTELPDGLRIVPVPLRSGGVPFDSRDDHRMVMAAAVLGLVVPGLRVRGAATVGKTFPGFTRTWEQMAAGRR